MDGSFHSPEWHAARLASLKTSHTITWEEYKKKQKVMCYIASLLIFVEIFQNFSYLCLWHNIFCPHIHATRFICTIC